MDKDLIEVFDCEMQCEYKGRKYRVRDNGAIMRLPKEGGRSSVYDNVWTFGTKNLQTGYMFFTGDVRVHQVVCTAFHGPSPDRHMVVDHINGNRCDNHPENLRWITREDNIFDNPVTVMKMEYRFGSIDVARKMLHENPQEFRRLLEENASGTKWMRPVSREEAANHAKHNEVWLQSGSKEIPADKSSGDSVGDWVFKEPMFSKEEIEEAKSWYGGSWPSPSSFPSWREQQAAIEEEMKRQHYEALELKDSLTPRAKQLEWKTPTEFPQTPQEITGTPLQDYLSRLSKGIVFCRNQYGDSPVYEAAMAEDGSHLAVVTNISGTSGVKKYALSEVSFSEGQFIHKSIRTFFEEEGAIKYFTLSLGREWKGGDVFDDFC